MASGECGGHWGGAKILQKIMVHPLSVTTINKYCGVGGGGRGGMSRVILQRVIQQQRVILQQIMAPLPLSLR